MQQTRAKPFVSEGLGDERALVVAPAMLDCCEHRGGARLRVSRDQSGDAAHFRIIPFAPPA
jgi:hypothetical protein